MYVFRYQKRSINADADFQRLVDRIWSLDKNRLAFGYDIRLAHQGRVSWYDNGVDAASYPLFYHVNKDVLKKPTFKGKLSANAFFGLKAAIAAIRMCLCDCTTIIQINLSYYLS